MYVLVAPFSGSFDEVGLIYLVPTFLEEQIKKGQIIEIPFRWKIEIWLVLNFWTFDFLKIQINISKIKSIISIKNNFIFLNNRQIGLVNFIASFYFTNISNSLNLFFPKNLKDKIKNNKIELISSKEYKYEYKNIQNLNIHQQEIYEKIKKSKNDNFLLFWVTWSWKTEIYIKLIKDNLEKWKQSLLLIPEIILTNQLATRLDNIFGKDIIVLNSTITEWKKTKFWLDIYFWNAKIIIWTRSSLFYPYNNLWLIIIDEEHDNSYISDINPRYKAIEIAEQISKSNWSKLLLGSWTPNITSMYKALKGEFELLNLLEKFK